MSPVDAVWFGVPTAELIRHLLDTHHVFTRTEIKRLRPLVASQPQLAELSKLFEALANELEPHLEKEEQILFPMMQQRVDVCGPIAVMEEEHEQVRDLLRELRGATSNYTPPEDASPSLRVLYSGLAALEADLQEHIHLENDVLFVRVMSP